MTFDQTDLEFCDGPLDGVRIREWPAARLDKILLVDTDGRLIRYEIDRSRTEEGGPRPPGIDPRVRQTEILEARETRLDPDYDDEIREALERGEVG